MQVHVFVLHLARASARRDNAQALLENAQDIAGTTGELWPAVDGSTLSASELSSRVGSNLFDPAYPFPLKNGEIGCFLSHRAIWAEIIRRDLDAGLVFEDDVTLDTEVFAKAFGLAAKHVSKIGYVQLQNRPTKGTAHLVERRGPCSLNVPTITPVRASAQLISKSAAERLLSESENFDRPVDTFVQSHWFTGFRPGVIYPSGVSTISESLDGSTIQIRPKSFFEKLQREKNRFFYRRAVAKHSRASRASETPDSE
jgi:GR25 family glycosyltransferase involved in LPS biosynthesis